MNAPTTRQSLILLGIGLLTIIGFSYLQGVGPTRHDIEVADETLRQYASTAEVALQIQNKKQDTLRVASAYVESLRNTERIDLGKCTVYDLPPGEAKECETVVDKAASYRVAGIEGYRRRDISIRQVDIPLN